MNMEPGKALEETRGVVEDLVKQLEAKSEPVPEKVQQLRQQLDNDQQAAEAQESERQQAEVADKATERQEILTAQRKLESVKGELNAALSQVTNPDAKREVERALQAVSSINIVSRGDVQQTSTTVDQARQTAAGAEGQAMLETAGNAVAGLVGFGAAAATFSALLDPKTLSGIQSWTNGLASADLSNAAHFTAAVQPGNQALSEEILRQSKALGTLGA